MKTVLSMRKRQLRDLSISFMIGTCVGIAILAALILPHDWKPMGRLGTFYVSGLLLSAVHAAVCFVVFLPLSFWAERFLSQGRILQAFSFGGVLYGVIALLLQASFDNVGSESMWLLAITIPVGGTMAAIYVQLRRKSKTEPTGQP